MQYFRTLLVLLLIGNLGLPAWGMHRCCCTQQSESSGQRSCCAGQQAKSSAAKPARNCCASRNHPKQSERRSAHGPVAEQPIHLCQCVRTRAMIPAKLVLGPNSDTTAFVSLATPRSGEKESSVSQLEMIAPSESRNSGRGLLSQIGRWQI